MDKSNKNSIKVIFICQGNICRSPSAEAIMLSLIQKNGLENKIECDSAGTIDYHIGEPADANMKKQALIRGYSLKSISRPFENKDFKYFDWIITMDENNYKDITRRDPQNKYYTKIKRITEFCNKIQVKEVPDPYYGSSQGFQNVIDILEDACDGLLEFIIQKT